MKNKRKQSILKLAVDPKAIIGIIISIIGIYWAFKDFSFIDFKKSLNQIDLIYLVIASLFLWGSVWLRGIRWKFLFKDDTAPTIKSLYRAELIGYFGNNILPLRLGELLRSLIVSKEYSFSKSFVFGTVILERLMDTMTLSLFALLLFLIYPLESDIKGYVLWGGIILFVSIIVLLIILNRIQIFQTENYNATVHRFSHRYCK